MSARAPDTATEQPGLPPSGPGHAGHAEPGLDDVIAEYIQAREQGRTPDHAAWRARFPALAGELTAFFSTYERMEALAPALQPGVGTSLGDYELVEELGRGGMGVVYRARQRSLDREVALKVIRAGQLATDEERQRFAREAHVAARASHPGIVPVYEIGEHAGHAYLAMQLVAGGSLADHLARVRADAPLDVRARPAPLARVVSIVRQVALAIQHAHEHGILHRDLKPANILLDVDDRPLVADFGLAKRLDGDSLTTGHGAILGTACYMAPEQAAGAAVTVASDVYGLGAILYELATGRPPFVGATVLDTLDRVRTADPDHPSAIDARVDADLAAICLQCLDKDPQARYRSAADLADDLGRWLDRRPVVARRLGTLARAMRWCRRHPERAALALAASALVVVSALMASSELHTASHASAEARGRSDEILDGNRFSARHVAETVRRRINDLGVPVARAAAQPELGRLLAAGDAAGLARAVDELGGRFGHQDGYENWLVIDAQGSMLARWPALPDSLIRSDFSGRDYFAGAVRRHGDLHVSHAYVSMLDRRYKFAISAAVLHEDRLAGLLVSSFPTGPTLGLIELHDRTHTAALIARMDPTSRDDRSSLDPTTRDNPGELRIIVHPAYRPHEQAVLVDAALAARLTGASSGGIERYEDPVGRTHPDYSGPWIAGFAQVPDTPFIVLIQRRYDGVRLTQEALAAAQRRWYMVAAGLALAIAGVLGGVHLARRRTSATRAA
jgi:tRNA A-37 threonylcarbamoyl transferase component Bud32